MKCRLVPEASAEVLGGEASPALEADLRAHLAACQGCARVHRGLGDLIARARTAEVPEPPAPYWPRFRADLRRRIEVEPERFGALRWLRPLAAMTALATFTLILVRPAVQTTPIATAPGPDAARIAALASTIDVLGTDDTSLSRELFGSEDATAAAESLLAQPSGDVFSFLDSSFSLDPQQTRSVVDQLAKDFEG